jgi:hypothetical protein
MKLVRPFFRLPLRFDVERLRNEIEALPADAWARHPNDIPGNSALRLLSVDGGENDGLHGLMQPTPHLERCPYIRQVLANFGVVWSRSRLMRLAPHSTVPEHADINYHWFYRVRMHIPIITRPEVRFHCDGQSVHMAPGEAWIFDNWRRHHVENPTDDERIHLVADTSGTAAFWQFVAQAGSGGAADATLEYRPGVDARLLTERVIPRPVMPPAEVELLLADFRGELVPTEDSAEARARLARYHWLLQGFCFDWRQLYALSGESPSGLQEFSRVVDRLRSESRALAEGLMMRVNKVEAHRVLEARVLQHLVQASTATEAPLARSAVAGDSHRPRVRQPVFIVAAPRSGSTLLFETLSATSQFWTLGDEAHWLVESIPELQPAASGVDSNRLTAAHCTAEVSQRICGELLANLQDAGGNRLSQTAGEVRVLEKTPKNALRIPFFLEMFPDARFLLLWRDPRENISSIMEAWRSGGWTTYRRLEGWEGPWSLLLPPGWQSLRGKALEDIAAYQWECTNRIALDDLAALPGDRWTAVEYGELLSDPAATVRRLCGFAGIEFDDPLAARVAAPLPLSKYTQTRPAPEKWRRNEAEVMRVLPSVQATWERLKSLNPRT